MAEERRLVAIMFADIVDSTALSDNMDPEDTRTLMGRYFEHATAVVEAAGGRLEKFIGDAVVALFGVPRATGDEVERALSAALGLHEAVRADEILGPMIRIRVGVHLGEVITSMDPGADQFIASGDAMNTAARLQQAAEPGEVLASDRVVLASEDGFEFARPRLVQLKGKSGSHRVFRALGRRTSRRSERPPMAGRRRDLLQLRLSAERVAQEGRVGLVTVLGAQGIGKTRLVEEFLVALPGDAEFELVTAATGRHGEAGSEQLSALLEGLLGTRVEHERVAGVFRLGDYAPEESRGLARQVLAAVGDGGRVGEDGRSMLSALRSFVELAVGVRRIIMFLDDAHQVSDTMLDLIEQLAASRVTSRMLLIVAARPELMKRRPVWGAGRGSHTSLTLEALTDAQTRSLVQHYLSQDSDGRVEAITSRANGNPFFALEFVRTVLRTGPEARAHEPGSKLPDTVHAAVLARLDLLSACARSVLKLIAVGGTAIPRRSYPDLLTDWNAHEIDEAVDELLGQHMVGTEEGRRISVRQSYIQEVIYGTISRAAAIRLHCDVATTLADGDDESSRASLAIGRHFLTAVALSRRAVAASAPFNPDRTTRHLLEAGLTASRSGQTTAALEFAEGALTVAPPHRHAEILELLGTLSGVSPSAPSYLERALDRLDAADLAPEASRQTAVRLHRKLLILWLRCGLMDRCGVSQEQVLSHYLRAGRLAETGVDLDEALRLRAVELFLFLDQRLMRVQDGAFVAVTSPDDLIATGREIVRHFIDLGDGEAASEVLDGCHSVASRMGLPELALEFCVMRMALEDLSPIEFGDALAMLAASYSAAGSPIAGLEAVEKEVVRHRRTAHATFFAHPLSRALAIAYTRGEWEWADRLAPHMFQAYEDALHFPQDKAFCVDGLLSLLRIALARGSREQANNLAELLLDSIQELPARVEYGKAMVSMELQDMPYTGEASACGSGAQAAALVNFNNERGEPTPPGIVEMARGHGTAESAQDAAIAEAIRNRDGRRLAAGIDDLERRGRLVTAARLRIVLARHTGDGSVLRPARKCLERLQDVRFLRRLESVERALDVPPT